MVLRYVLPVEAPIPLDEDGFLELAPSRWWSGERPCRAGDLLDGDASFALLAAGGVGKTVTLRALAESEQAAVVDAGLLTRVELLPRLQEIVRQGGPGYLDGLDQAAAFDARLLPWLETILVADQARCVRWRLGCRSAAWDSALGGVLRRELPGFEVWKLLPLDRVAAVELLSCEGLDGERFVDELVRARLGRLSACVTRLLAAARYWREHGALRRDGAVQAIDFEVRGLLQEWDTRRRPAWPQDRGLRVAKRLAAFTMFSGRTTLTSEPSGGSATLSVVDLPSEAEPAELDRPVEPADYSSVLDTPLFDPAHSACVAFRHQAYQEFLAAAYLIDRRVVREQVDALLGVSPAGVLPTTRIGVAAWLATLRLELVEPLIERNASKFAESVVAELPSDRARSAVVASLLRAAAVDEQRPDWRLDLAGLDHEGLEEQLVERLQQGVASTEQLWWIARLAAACSCVRAVPGLLAEAHNRTWFAYGRRAAAVAVTELGDDAQRRALLGILGEGDEYGEVLAAVIDGLYPRLMTTVELTSVLRPASRDFLGAYRMTLKGLVDRIPSEDLAWFGRWLSTKVREHGHPRDFDDLLSRLVKRMWGSADDPEVRAALAELLHRSERSGYWYSHEHGAVAPWQDGDDADRRRELAIELATRGGEDAGHDVVTLGLLTPADMAWLLDQVTQPGPVQELLFRCVPYLVGSPASAAAADAILAMDPSHPAYAVTSGWRGSSRLDDPQYASRRERIARQREYERQVADDDDRHRAALHDAIARLAEEPALWWRVAELLAAGDDRSDEVFNHDLTARTRWATVTPDQQETILDAGLRYVRSHRPHADAWCMAEQITHSQVLPDWAGVHLMATLAHHRPDTLTSLDDTIWTAWAHSIIAAWHLTEATSGARLDLIDIAMAANSDAVVEAALTHLDHLQQAGKALTSHEVYRRVVAASPARFAAALISGRYQQELGESLLQIVAHHGNSAGSDVCHRIAHDIEHPLRLPAWAHLAALDPNLVVDHLTSLPVHDTETSTLVASLDIGGLDTDHLERAAQLVLNLCPPHADPPQRPGWRFSDDSPLQVIRSRALDRLAVHGRVEALERIKTVLSEADQRVIASYLQSARTRQADLALVTVEPASLLQLLRRADARLIRDDSDLQQVVLAQLGQLQDDIRHTGAYREIWRDDRPQSEDDISDWIRRRLEERITRGMLIDREPQVHRTASRGVGTRIDLTATATTTSRDVARVVIEAKHHSNRELMTAMRDQLIERYLAPTGRRHGIYLVYWTTPSQRPTGMSRSTSPDAQDLKRALTNQAEQQLREAGWAVTPFIMDISQPQAQ